MLNTTRQLFNDVLIGTPWSLELAGILPLSALINFLNIPLVLHVYQLTKTVPLWCWPITPSGSRLLLSEAANESDSCVLDRFGNSPNPICLDGRYGDTYPLANPETMRLCLGAISTKEIKNLSENMSKDSKRLQILEVIHVARIASKSRFLYSFHAIAASILGWVLLLGLAALSISLRCYLTLAFMIVVSLTGTVISAIHGSKPRRLRITDHGSQYNRLVVSALHMNETRWQIFYGESSVVNSLLN